MARADRLVSRSERIHLVSREHGVVLIRPFLRAAVVVAVGGAAALEASSSSLPAILRWSVAVLIAAVVSLALLVYVCNKDRGVPLAVRLDERSGRDQWHGPTLGL